MIVPQVFAPFKVAFTGRAGSGKTTAANFLVEKFGAFKFSFATALKAEVYDFLLEYRTAMRYGEKTLKEFLDVNNHKWMWVPQCPTLWNSPLPPTVYFNSATSEKVEWVNANKLWLRELLQWWGGDYRRSPDSGTYWIDKLKNDIILAACEYKSIVIDDVRYENEAAWLKSAGFVIVQIARHNSFQYTHSGEGNLINVDFMIDNNTTIHKLYNDVAYVATTREKNGEFKHGKI